MTESRIRGDNVAVQPCSRGKDPPNHQNTIGTREGTCRRIVIFVSRCSRILMSNQRLAIWSCHRHLAMAIMIAQPRCAAHGGASTEQAPDLPCHAAVAILL